MRKAIALSIVAALGAFMACGDDETQESTKVTEAGSLSACASGSCEVEATWRVPYLEDATYEELVDVFGPAEPGPWPMVVLAHAKFGSRSDVKSLARDVASQGAVAVTVGYPDTPPYVASTEHLGCAVRFARSIAEDHGGDPDNVTLFGHSIGAAVGAVVALDEGLSTERCLATDGSTAPEALVGYEGPYDIALEDDDVPGTTSREADEPDIWRSVNPYSNVGQHPELVIRLIQGIDEDLDRYDVPPHVSEDFYRALLDAGYDVELIMIDDATHAAAVTSGSEAFEVTVAAIIEVARA